MGRDESTLDAADLRSRAASGSDFPPATPVGRYLVLGPLGKGGMGAVYAAYDTELDRRVALKFLRNRATGPEAETWRARLVREARAMARLSHPNVVTLYDVAPSSDGSVFLAMELVEGGTLRDWLRAEPRTWRQIVSMLCEAGEGLAAAHREGMIHRDFKLENVLLGKDGRPRVTDFGLARGAEAPPTQETAPVGASAREPPLPAVPAISPEAAESGPRVGLASPGSAGSLERLTLTGALLGTPGYMAPEQYVGEEIDARADVFAFSATLYRALYGERPFGGATVEQIAEATLEGRIRPAPKGSDVPAWVHRAVLWGMSAEKEARPASMAELLRTLRADPAQRRRRWLLAGGAAAAACAALLGARVASARRVQACHAMADRLGGVWDGPRREAIGRAFHATGLSYADDTWERVAKRLDGYAASWTGAMEQACTATRVRGERSEATLDLQASCLDERLDALRALSDIFASADGTTVAKAVDAVTALPSLAPCSNLEELSVATRLPSDPETRREIRALQATVAAANELALAGRPEQSRERLEGIRARVDARKYAPVTLAWTMALAETDRKRDMQRSADEWRQAIALAETSHLDREKARCELGLIDRLSDLGKYEDAHQWLVFAVATLDRIGGDPSLELRRDVNEGWIDLEEAKYADAARVLERALARARAHPDEAPKDPRLLADVESGLGGALAHDEERYEEAVTHERAAIAMTEDALGPQHLDVADALANLAAVELLVGRADDALASASRARAMYQAAIERGELSAQNAYLGDAIGSMGEAQLRLGRAREAAPLLEQARAIYRANGLGLSHDVVQVDACLAEAYRQLGRLADAAAACDDARRIGEGSKEIPPMEFVPLLNVEARLALDRGEDALPLAERAVALAQPGAARPYDAATARLVLARALAGAKPDAPRARALAEEARDRFAKLHDARGVGEASAVLEQVPRP